MAGFGVKKSCVHQNPLIFFPVTGSRYVLFQSSVFAVQPEFWAAISWLPASNPFDSGRHLIDPGLRQQASAISSFVPTTRRCANGFALCHWTKPSVKFLKTRDYRHEADHRELAGVDVNGRSEAAQVATVASAG